MPEINFGKINRWEPRQERLWKPRADGSFECVIECEEGVVELFTFPGSQTQRAFTNLKMWIHPHRYDVTLRRHYHERWIRRLAREFAWACQRMADRNAAV